MILLAEKFLVVYISKSSEKNNFDDIRFETYYQKSLPRKITTDIVIHPIYIKRAFLQCYLWLHALFVESIEINPEDYGYEFTEDDMLVPTITFKNVLPDDFPVPCIL